MLPPTDAETAKRKQVLADIVVAVDCNQTIRLPRLNDPTASDNQFSGTVGPYSYQFEGEDDLLHLIVTRTDSAALKPEEGQAVAAFLLEGLPPGLVWIKPGELSQHFYCGHDDLVANVRD